MMIRSAIAMVVLGASGLPALAQTADQRAIEACKRTSQAFTEIASCLPQADVAVMTLDAFAQIFPEAAKPLSEKCVQLNGDNMVGAATCVTEAVEAAIGLKEKLPAGVDLNDPVFAAVADAGLMRQLKVKIDDARAKYPEVRLWGGNLYKAYR